VTLLDAAQSYGARGWRVLPVKGKIHLVKNWPALASTDDATIKEWWTRYPEANIGIATGALSDLFVLDVDPDKGGEDSLRSLEAQFGSLPQTIEVLTGGGGRHYYFRHPRIPIGNSASQLGPGLDIKTEGGQVVAPPSIHPKTKRAYEWEAAHHPDDVSLAEVPAWLLQHLTAQPGQGRPTFVVPASIPDGQRNDQLFRLARALKLKGLSQEAILVALACENAVKCPHPLPADELEQLVTHAWTQHDRAAFVQNGHASVPQDEAPALDGLDITGFDDLIAQRAAASADDPEPIALDSVDVPSFPTNVIPAAWLRDMVESTAKATETPVELALLLSLAVVATSVQRKYVVEPESGYTEPLNLWVCPALDSGARKTSVLTKMTGPLIEFERQHAARIAPEILKAASARQLAEDRVKYLRQKAAKAEGQALDSLRHDLLDEEAALPDVPKALRLWAQDVTPEKLGQLMADHNETMAILSDEGGLFDILAGRYSQGVPNLDLFLQAHSGAAYRVDRGSRPSVFMNTPALTLGLSPQPAVLRGLAKTPGFRGRGLLARFLFALPQSTLGYRTLESQPIPPEIHAG
jgi:hypothetical protein